MPMSIISQRSPMSDCRRSLGQNHLKGNRERATGNSVGFAGDLNPLKSGGLQRLEQVLHRNGKRLVPHRSLFPIPFLLNTSNISEFATIIIKAIKKKSCKYTHQTG
ncbi:MULTISPECIES: hypothetical protein [unclassified Anabaena]|uniref:hypothetical protein n=1 Tax=unclassified Anabaena TaxID=2619674 RepID=UPI0012E8462B|nr:MULTISPECIES: hypothetical protein [unclassified Anabaena]